MKSVTTNFQVKFIFYFAFCNLFSPSFSFLVLIYFLPFLSFPFSSFSFILFLFILLLLLCSHPTLSVSNEIVYQMNESSKVLNKRHFQHHELLRCLPRPCVCMCFGDAWLMRRENSARGKLLRWRGWEMRQTVKDREK